VLQMCPPKCAADGEQCDHTNRHCPLDPFGPMNLWGAWQTDQAGPCWNRFCLDSVRYRAHRAPRIFTFKSLPGKESPSVTQITQRRDETHIRLRNYMSIVVLRERDGTSRDVLGNNVQ